MYQDEWTPVLHETLSCCRELANIHDPFAAKVMKAGSTVGHLLKKISSTCSLFIMKSGVISCKVTDPNRKYSRDLAEGGLEIPCVITLQGTKKLVEKAKKLLNLSKKGLKPTGEVSVLSASPDPNLKWIKSEQNEMEVDQSQDQPIACVWVKFPGTRIQLFADNKMMIEEHHRLNDRHINFVQAMLRAQFPKCDGLKNTLLQD